MTVSSTTILIVDDDEFQRELIGMQLQGLGWSDLIFADCGEAALAQYDAHRTDVRVIISDLSMPDMDGLILMRHLAHRKVEAAIVLVSGVSEEILNSAAGLASAHGLQLLGVLPKPSSSEHLRALLDKMQAGTKRSQVVHGVALTTERLQLALESKEILPWYQPKVDVATGRPFGVEALARWPLPDGSMIGPGEFVPLIEQCGLADALFMSMLEQVTCDVMCWQPSGMQLKVSVNLSMDCALNLDLPEQVLRMVVGRGLQPHDFVIEVTESRLMVERSVAMESLTRLSLMGFHLSIDDFGTGYSSLVQLVDLPFKELKIDGSFVQRAEQDLKARTILRIATSLGLNLGMGVVAEGVETSEQLQLVRDCGCASVQGYYFAKPMPFKTCSQWFDERSLLLEQT